jgi:phosphoribosyl 1,2-cyclic phosphodiesterase
VDIAIIEANHDVDMLKNGNYPYHLKRRILSSRGHLSNEVCGALAVSLMRHGARRLILAHLSRENNTPKLAQSAVRRALSSTGAGEELVTVDVAPADDIGKMYIL